MGEEQIITSIRALIFDLDGTLSDSNELQMRTFVEACNRFGFKVSQKQGEKYFGVKTKEILKTLHPEATDEDAKKVSELKWQLYEQELNKIKIFEHEREFLNKAMQKYALAVASSTPKRFIMMSLKALGIKNHFKEIIGGDEVKKGKPNPELLFLCAKRMGAKPEECCYIGDAIVDAGAAKRAGMKFMRFHSNDENNEEYKKQEVWADVKSYKELARLLGLE